MHDEDEEALVEAVRRFVAKEIKPRVNAIESQDAYPDDVIARMVELGLFSIVIPEQYGGLGLDVPVYARLMEELAAGWTSLPSFINSHCSVSSILAKYGTEEQKERYLPRMATGEMRGAIALTESNAGSDLQAIRTTAMPSEGGGFRVRGGKIFITNGARASLYLVLVKTDPRAVPAKDGMTLCIVERGAPGFRVGGLYHKMAFKHVDTAELIFDDVELPSSAIVGNATGKGMSQLLDVIETGRIAIAASAVGLGRSALAAALEYAKQRESFGTPIANHQAVQCLLAEMAAKVMAARSLTMEAARIKHRGLRCDMVAGMAKLVASEMSAEVCLAAVRVHGGYGYVSEFPVERLYREAPMYIVTEGTNEIQKMVIAKRLLAGDAESIGLL
ncbi:MAG: acyl-CoA dehydrogenase [Variovorax sp.]|nr:MAG: acyl-CoA dehydrogenase [Variovorax sp.]